MKRILILEDIAEARNWLERIVLEIYPQAEVVTASRVAVAKTLALQPIDLALIDLGLPDGSGLEVLRILRRSNPAAIKVVTTVMGDDASIVSALAAGADGYLLKESKTSMLVQQLQQLGHGIPAISPAIARRIMQHFRLTGPVTTIEDRLTARETEVLSLIASGLRNAEVAHVMSIAESTVAGYIKVVYRKLGISSRAEAAWHATQLGLRSGGPVED
ncbi:DNA-binding NarL/FixJ family response regulator [Sagittula marina]|uniref:DNA-binding NarL/FixJ family response regulator n=1 Tax=Sagittula marina TaxID=943940 RepID=A0A7W6DNE8_9RHOB|nr:response regulator transcription factor [Sagittula marina]MBB3986243.1 DNA-binding NarL/FixJ family response regulator [Sagittula marina]